MINFRVIIQTVINFRMLSTGGQREPIVLLSQHVCFHISLTATTCNLLSTRYILSTVYIRE